MPDAAGSVDWGEICHFEGMFRGCEESWKVNSKVLELRVVNDDGLRASDLLEIGLMCYNLRTYSSTFRLNRLNSQVPWNSAGKRIILLKQFNMLESTVCEVLSKYDVYFHRICCL